MKEIENICRMLNWFHFFSDAIKIYYCFLVREKVAIHFTSLKKI